MHFFLPTNEQNALSRLFFRYFLLYVSALPFGFWLSKQQFFAAVTIPLPFAALLPVVFATLLAFFTLTGPLMVLLTFLKGCVDFLFLIDLISLAGNAEISLLHFNIVLFLIGAGIIIYILAAANARLFAFENTSRDLSLVLSKPFFRYLTQAAVFVTIAAFLYYLWQKLLTLLPLLQQL